MNCFLQLLFSKFCVSTCLTNNIYLNLEKAKRNNKNIKKHSMIPTRKISPSIWQYLKITLLIIIYCTKLFETSTWYKHNFSCLIVYWHILIINNDFINTTNLYFTCALCNQRCHINICLLHNSFLSNLLQVQKKTTSCYSRYARVSRFRTWG